TNTGNIATNTANISTNTANIGTNTANILTNTGNIATNTANIATNTGNIATNTANIATNRGIAADGIAIALASKTPTIMPGQNYAVTAALGNFDSSTAFALGGAMRIGDQIQAFGTIGTAFGSGEIGTSMGVQWNW
ncbi:YadA-like family protein, partial [Aliiroseovarius crassostreae]